MSTTTVRLDDSDKELLDALAPEFGGRSSAIRFAIRRLAADLERRHALASFLAAWEVESGSIDEFAVVDMAERYGL